MSDLRRRQKYKHITDEEWKRVRIHYESSDLSQRKLSEHYGISESTVMKRANREGWKQGAQLVAAARQNLAAQVTEEAAKATQLAAKQIVDELAPWIAEQKLAQVKRAVERSTKAQARLDRVSESYTVLDKEGNAVEMPVSPKDLGYLAAAEDKFDNIIRRNLGMNDGIAVGGAINVSILANQAAVQVAAPAQ